MSCRKKIFEYLVKRPLYGSQISVDQDWLAGDLHLREYSVYNHAELACDDVAQLVPAAAAIGAGSFSGKRADESAVLSGVSLCRSCLETLPGRSSAIEGREPRVTQPNRRRQCSTACRTLRTKLTSFLDTKRVEKWSLQKASIAAVAMLAMAFITSSFGHFSTSLASDDEHPVLSDSRVQCVTQASMEGQSVVEIFEECVDHDLDACIKEGTALPFYYIRSDCLSIDAIEWSSVVSDYYAVLVDIVLSGEESREKSGFPPALPSLIRAHESWVSNGLLDCDFVGLRWGYGTLRIDDPALCTRDKIARRAILYIKWSHELADRG